MVSRAIGVVLGVCLAPPPPFCSYGLVASFLIEGVGVMAGVPKTHFNVLYGKLLTCVAKSPDRCPINVVALRQGLPSVHFVDQDAAKKYMEKYHDGTRRYMTKDAYRRNRRHRPELKTTNDALAKWGIDNSSTGFTDRDVQFATARCDEPMVLDVESVDGAPLSTFDPTRAAKQHIAAMAAAANRNNEHQLRKLKHAESLPGTTVVNKQTGEIVDATEIVDAAMLRIHEEKNREHAQNVLNTLASYKEFPNDWSDKFTSLDGTVTVTAKVVPDQFHEDAYASMSEEMRAACEVEEATIDYEKLDKLIEERPELRDLVYTGDTYVVESVIGQPVEMDQSDAMISSSFAGNRAKLTENASNVLAGLAAHRQRSQAHLYGEAIVDEETGEVKGHLLGSKASTKRKEDASKDKMKNLAGALDVRGHTGALFMPSKHNGSGVLVSNRRNRRRADTLAKTLPGDVLAEVMTATKRVPNEERARQAGWPESDIQRVFHARKVRVTVRDNESVIKRKNEETMERLGLAA